jgi:hypothetical protein
MTGLTDLNSLYSALRTDSSRVATIDRILSKLPEDLLRPYLGSIVVRDGEVVATFYAEIGANLSFQEFIELYAAFGFELIDISNWLDHQCFNAVGCRPAVGWTCRRNCGGPL